MMDNYKEALYKYIDNINLNEIRIATDMIKATIDADKKIFIIGNGGSMATAMHFTNDLMLSNDLKVKVFHLSNQSNMTAIANDNDYTEIFALQLKNLMSIGDLLIAISCSGNSLNIVKAVQYANTVGKTIGITGFHGGNVKSTSTYNIFVRTGIGEYELTEDIHSIICHMVTVNLRGKQC